MPLGEWKPVLAALALPPAGPLLLVAFGVLLGLRRRVAGFLVALVGLVLAWALSTNVMALALAGHLLPGVQAVQLQDVRRTQAIVVLGGGVLPRAPEYGEPQPGPPTLERLRYGAWLARHSGQPLAFAGGVGWAASGTDTASEGEVARRALQEDYGLKLRWMDDRSRDTAENAARMADLLQRDGVTRIALVTDATHMERAAAAFRARGFDVLPAPTNFPMAAERPLLQWLPSIHGADVCHQLLHEAVGRWVARGS